MTNYAGRIFSRIFTKLIPHRQFGSEPDGPALAAHAIRHAIATGLRVLGTDIAKAFNSIFRHYLFHVLHSYPQLKRIFAYAHYLYSHDNMMYICDSTGAILATFTAQEGVLQGDSLSSSLFDLAWTTFLNSLNLPPNLSSILIHDDTHLIHANIRTLLHSFLIIAKAAPLIGLHFNLSKSCLALLNSLIIIPRDIIHLCHQHKIKIENDLYRTIGTYTNPTNLNTSTTHMNTSPASIALTKDIQKLKPMFDIIAQLPPHIALTLLRCSYGARKLTYTLRSHSPTVAQAAACLLDNYSLETICIILKLPHPTDEFSTRASLPLRNGGLGNAAAQAISPAGYIASLANASDILQTSPSPPTPANNPHLFREIKAALDTLKNNTDPSFHTAFPTDHRNFFNFYETGGQGRDFVKKFQKAITCQIEHRRHQRLLQHRPSPAKTASNFSATSAYAAAAITARPSKQSPNHKYFRYLCLHRTNQSPFTYPLTASSKCACGFPLQTDPWHFLPCRTLNQTARPNDTIRHHTIVKAVADLIISLGGRARIEPRGLDPFTPLEGPDIEAFLGPDKYHLDVSITHLISAFRHYSHFREPLHNKT
jgi:hypothetical protein